MSHPVVFLAVPSYGQVEREAIPSLIRCARNAEAVTEFAGGSLLAHHFNELWCTALNNRQTARFTHFAMHHSDIAAEPGWLDTLIAEQQRTGADVVSAVVAIKDGRGLTSTGPLDRRKNQVRRLTLSEVHRLPETFSIADLPDYADSTLCVNTGLFVCDFTKPWVEKVWFEIRTKIGKNDAGLFEPRCLPEDWNFSIQCAELGLKVVATRKVKVSHYGRAVFDNETPWGTLKQDDGSR